MYLTSQRAISGLFRFLQDGVRVFVPVLILALLCASPAQAATEPLALDIMMARFIKNISGPLMHLTYVGSYIFGVYLIAKGLLKCVKYSDEGSRGQQKFSGLWGSMMVGALLCALPSTMDIMATTMLMDTQAGEPVLSYIANETDGEIKTRLERTYYAVLVFVQLLGIISFVRGLSILRSVTDGNTQVTSMAGITHVVAGAIGWNLGEFIQMVSKTVNVTI